MAVVSGDVSICLLRWPLCCREFTYRPRAESKWHPAASCAGALEPPHAPLLAAWADFEAAAGDRDAAAALWARCRELQPPDAAAGGRRKSGKKQHGEGQGAEVQLLRHTGQRQGEQMQYE